MNETMRTIKVQVYGRVQGVFFRKYTRDYARPLKITGHVRNKVNGSVEIVAQGPPFMIDRFLAAVKEGSPWSSVDELVVTDLEVEVRYHSFEIRY